MYPTTPKFDLAANTLLILFNKPTKSCNSENLLSAKHSREWLKNYWILQKYKFRVHLIPLCFKVIATNGVLKHNDKADKESLSGNV